MPIPLQVQQALNLRVRSPNTRKALTEAFEGWGKSNRSLTRWILAGAHRNPWSVEAAALLAARSGNPLLALPAELLSIAKLGASALEAGIWRLGKYYEARASLTGETRKHFEELMGALSRSRNPYQVC